MVWIFLTLVLIGGIALWRYASLRLFRNVPMGDYTVIERRNRYEIREYAPFIAAETEVKGDIVEASGRGFSILSRCVLGEGSNAEKGGAPEEKTVPIEAPAHTVFVVVPEREAGAAGKLDDPKVSTKLHPERRVAAMRFGWYPTQERVIRKAAELESLLLRDGPTPLGEPELILSDAPFSPPFFMKNEILFEVER